MSLWDTDFCSCIWIILFHISFADVYVRSGRKNLVSLRMNITLAFFKNLLYFSCHIFRLHSSPIDNILNAFRFENLRYRKLPSKKISFIEFRHLPKRFRDKDFLWHEFFLQVSHNTQKWRALIVPLNDCTYINHLIFTQKKLLIFLWTIRAWIHNLFFFVKAEKMRYAYSQTQTRECWDAGTLCGTLIY